MRLAEFFQTIGPLLSGQAGLEQTSARLYGDGALGPRRTDAERLGIYERFCRLHRFEAVDGVYAHCRGAVRRLLGEGAWAEIVEAYYRAHPMKSFELNANGAALPAFLQAEAGRLGLPPFLPELADFEWWEWQAQVAEDAPEDRAPDSGPLRLGATVELRSYQHDLVSWLDEAGPEERAPAPEAEETLVLFWRDRALAPRRERASALELLVLRAVHEGGGVEALLAAGGLPPANVAETVADLRQAGILLGAP